MRNTTERLLQLVGLLAWGSSAALAADQTQIYSCRTTASGTAWAAPCFDSNPSAGWATSTGLGTATGDPSRPGCFYHTLSTMTAGRGWGCQLMSDTTVGQRWIVYVNIPTSNSSSDALFAISSTNSILEVTPGGAAATTTDAFRTSTGGGANWGFVCYITPKTGAGFSGLHPQITFGYQSGINNRAYADCIKFVPDLGCLATSPVTIGAPYITNMTSFTVSGVTNATAIAVYKQMGSEPRTMVGYLNTGIVNGDNNVPLLNGATLEKNVRIWATQTVSGVEGCDHQPDYYVGIGNTGLKFSFNMRAQNGASGPIGAGGAVDTANYGYYFMPSVASNTVNYPTGGLDIPASPNWQSVTIDPRTVSHGNTWINQGTWPAGNPWANGRPAFGAIDSFCFAMSDTNSGPYEVYIDNLGSGATLIHDMEDAPPNSVSGLFTTFDNEGSTSPLLTGTTDPLAICNIACLTNSTPPNQAESGTNSQYIKWQWKTIGVNGSVWLRKLANAATEANWVSYPQVDLSKPIHFDILLAPLGTTPHALGNLTWMDDVTGCVGSSYTFSVSAQGPTDPANTSQTLARTFSYQWSKNGTAIPGAGGTAYVGPTDPPATLSYSLSSLTTANAGTYSVVVSDGTSSLTRSAILTTPNTISVDSVLGDPGYALEAGSTWSLMANASIIGACPCGNAAPIAYQWTRNGVPVPGATDSMLTFNSLQVSDAGHYSVLVTNTCNGQYASGGNVQIAVYDPSVIQAQGCGNGILGLYWTNHLSSAPYTGDATYTNVDPSISFNWGTGSFNPGQYPTATDYFTVRWVGTVQAPYDGQHYKFYTTTDDGVRLWVNGQLLIDKWVNQSATTWNNTIVLSTNTPTDLVMEYYENGVTAEAYLSWESESTYSNVVPTSAFCAADPSTGIPPITTLTAPANNATATLPNAVTLTAGVTQSSAPVNKVEFYHNATNLLATVVAPGPYTTSWAPPATGVYNISAKTYYNTSHFLTTPSNKLTVNAPVLAGVTITNISGTTLKYTGGSGSQFVLLNSASLSTPLSSWTRVATNAATPGSFTIPAVGSGTQTFYRIKSE